MLLDVTFPEPHMITLEKGVWPSCCGAVDKMHLHDLHFSVGFVYNIYQSENESCTISPSPGPRSLSPCRFPQSVVHRSI